MTGPYRVKLAWKGGDPGQFLYLLLLYTNPFILFNDQFGKNNKPLFLSYSKGRGVLL